MARTNATNFTAALQFPKATAATDLFKKEDVQVLAEAVDQHDHSAGKGVVVNVAGIAAGAINGSQITDNTITSAKITDGTIATADLANASVTNAKLASDTARANLLTNGGFEIWQRGNGPFTAAGAYGPDRWALNVDGTDTLSVSRDAANVDTSLGSQVAAACVYTHGSGVNTSLFERLNTTEPVGLLARTVTYSVRVRTSTANAVRIAFYNSGAWTLGTFHTGDGTWQTLSLTATLAGTFWQLGVFFQTTSCTAYLDNAMLVVGSQAADYAPLHPADDLARCLRYYEQIGSVPGIIGTGQAYSTTTAFGYLSWKVKKATTPSITTSVVGNYNVTNSVGTGVQCTGFTISAPTLDGARYDGVASGLAAGNASCLFVGGAGSPIVIEANP